MVCLFVVCLLVGWLVGEIMMMMMLTTTTRTRAMVMMITTPTCWQNVQH